MSQREEPDHIFISRSMRSLQKYESTHVYTHITVKYHQKNEMKKNFKKEITPVKLGERENMSEICTGRQRKCLRIKKERKYFLVNDHLI